MFPSFPAALAPDVPGALLPPLNHDLPPVLGMLAGALAAVWIGCAVATASLLATALVLGLRAFVRGGTRTSAAPTAASAQHTGADEDGRPAAVTDLDHYRYQRTVSNPAEGITDPHWPDGDPAWATRTGKPTRLCPLWILLS